MFDWRRPCRVVYKSVEHSRPSGTTYLARWDRDALAIRSISPGNDVDCAATTAPAHSPDAISLTASLIILFLSVCECTSGSSNTLLFISIFLLMCSPLKSPDPDIWRSEWLFQFVAAYVLLLIHCLTGFASNENIQKYFSFWYSISTKHKIQLRTL